MDEFIRTFVFAQQLFPDEHTAYQTSEIIEEIMETPSPRLRDIVPRMAGNEVASYKRIRRL